MRRPWATSGSLAANGPVEVYGAATVSGGVVTLNSTLTINGDLNLTGGVVDQPTSGSDITVTNSFTWTGGILNSTSNEATFYLAGATATINPGEGDTLTTGDAFNLVAGTNASVGVGTINFSNGSPITIDGSSMLISAEPGKAVEFTGPDGSYIDGKAKIELKNQGGFTISGTDFDAKNRIFVNNGGDLTLRQGATATFGSNTKPPAGSLLVTDILQNSGTITIGASCTLTSPYGAMEVKNGSLYVEAQPYSMTGTIGCQFTFSGGKIQITGNYGILRLKEDFYWLGGTFVSPVDCTANKSDQIVAEKKFFVGGTATVQIIALNANADNSLPAGFERTILSAAGGFKNVVPNQAPSITLVNPQNGPQFQLLRSTLLNGGEVYDLYAAS